MAIISSRFCFIVTFSFYIIGCSVHDDVVYSVAEINGEVVSKWPYHKYGLKIHVRADNTQVFHRTSRVFGIPVETVDGPNESFVRPHSFFVAIKAEPGVVVSWDPYQLYLFYGNRKINHVKISHVNMISFDSSCMSKDNLPSEVVELHDSHYVCVRAEFDIDMISPLENFGFELSGLYMNSDKLKPIFFEFKRAEYKSLQF